MPVGKAEDWVAELHLIYNIYRGATDTLLKLHVLRLSQSIGCMLYYLTVPAFSSLFSTICLRLQADE